jgi:hypothetical protein
MQAGPTACGVGVNGNYLYWADYQGGSIGRASLDGKDLDRHFIETADPVGIAIQGDYIYWGRVGSSAVDTAIGRAKLDGTDVDDKFISGASNPGVVTVTDRYVYWGNGGPALAGTTIGRANLDGSSATQNLFSAPGISALAVYGNQIYWANDISLVTGTIDLASLDGRQPSRTFIHDSQHIGAPYGFEIGPGT